MLRPLPTLLESNEPSIGWKVRVGVLGEDAQSRAVRALREEIRASPRVRALLARRAPRAASRRDAAFTTSGKVLTGFSRALRPRVSRGRRRAVPGARPDPGLVAQSRVL